MHSRICPGAYVVLRLPSDTLKLVHIVPNTVVSIGKFGSFPCNLLIGRPYFLAFEIADRQSDQDPTRLRVVPAAELNAEILSEDAPPAETPAAGPAETAGPPPDPAAADSSFDVVADDGSVLIKNNRLTVDNAARQMLTMQEIEELKRAGTGSGKDIIERILKSHTKLDEKTSFSLAKYTLRKHKKYMRRFTVLPMDVSMLTEYMLAEKESSRIMELREESLGLIGSWANVHYSESTPQSLAEGGPQIGGGRWLVVDETGGLVAASLAEKMGILHHPDHDDDKDGDDEPRDKSAATDAAVDVSMKDGGDDDDDDGGAAPGDKDGPDTPQSRHNTHLASTNTLTVIHANAQPNLSMLKYFSYDTNNPSPTHPLHTHLKTLTWLQLIDPAADPTYDEPDTVPQSTLDAWKSGKRGAYYRKRRRWERCRNIVDETRAGGFDGIVIASVMEPATILKHTVPLLRGSAHVVVYSPTVEPLTELIDLYSRDRKAAFVAHIGQEDSGPPPEDDFPVDPRLLLGPTLQTSKIRPWQVLPGRTHPLMMYRGGAEGYIFTARKVTPVEGKIEARGKFSKKRKLG